MERVKSYDLSHWEGEKDPSITNDCLLSLEEGQVIYFPKLDFKIKDEERDVFSENLVSKDRKNLSYELSKDELKGCIADPATCVIIQSMMLRYAKQASEFVMKLLPDYKESIQIARTSFRPVEIEGREVPSYRKNDTLLHVDSFPSQPTGGMRILRFFSNVNPFDKPRVWRLGESYENVAKRFLGEIKRPLPLTRVLMQKLKITKSYRILYDHYMLGIHNKMKADTDYQKSVDQEKVEFPPHSSWLVYTDQVSHAVVSGQYVFEQSFYVPQEALKHREKSPLGIMEKLLKQTVSV